MTKIVSDDTKILISDNIGGQCDVIVLGTKGLISKANLEIDAFNSTIEKDDIEEGLDYEPLIDVNSTSMVDLSRAFEVIKRADYTVKFITNSTVINGTLIVGKNLDVVEDGDISDLTIVDVDKIEFNEDNIYMIY